MNKLQHAAALLGCLIVMLAAGASPEANEDRVRLILSKLPPQDSPAYRTIKGKAGKATGQVLRMTKGEMWSVPKASVEAVRNAVAAAGGEVHELGRDWNQLFHPAPADIKLSAQQKAMVDQVLASKATQGVRLMVAPVPSVLEYALTVDAASKQAHPSITLRLDGEKALTIVRRSVDMRSDMCVWRGSVVGTDASATIMWWPQGKLTGSVQHEGHLYSIRHLGGDVHALIEMSEERMPDDHPPAQKPQ